MVVKPVYPWIMKGYFHVLDKKKVCKRRLVCVLPPSLMDIDVSRLQVGA